MIQEKAEGNPSIGRFLRQCVAKGVFALWIASGLNNKFYSLKDTQMTV